MSELKRLTLGDVVALGQQGVELRVDLNVAVTGSCFLVTSLSISVIDVGDEELGLKGVNATLVRRGLNAVEVKLLTYTLKRKVLLIGLILLLIGSGR